MLFAARSNRYKRYIRFSVSIIAPYFSCRKWTHLKNNTLKYLIINIYIFYHLIKNHLPPSNHRQNGEIRLKPWFLGTNRFFCIKNNQFHTKTNVRFLTKQSKSSKNWTTGLLDSVTFHRQKASSLATLHFTKRSTVKHVALRSFSRSISNHWVTKWSSLTDLLQ